jgi:hypothetical protein
MIAKFLAGLAACASMICCQANAQGRAPGDVLLTELKKGGLVIYLRHMPADVGVDQYGVQGWWNECKLQRGLNDRGRVLARELGFVLRGLAVPVGAIWSGELCRIRETASLLGFTQVSVEVRPELNDFMTLDAQGRPHAEIVPGYQRALATPPPSGTNRIVVSHAQRGRFTAHPSLDLLPMGGASVFRPGADGSLQLVGMLRPEEWRLLGVSEP